VDGIPFENRELGRFGVNGRTVLQLASHKLFVRLIMNLNDCLPTPMAFVTMKQEIC
jgi:hypothetical protein